MGQNRDGRYVGIAPAARCRRAQFTYERRPPVIVLPIERALANPNEEKNVWVPVAFVNGKTLLYPGWLLIGGTEELVRAMSDCCPRIARNGSTDIDGVTTAMIGFRWIPVELAKTLADIQAGQPVAPSAA